LLTAKHQLGENVIPVVCGNELPVTAPVVNG
jgi:hypothetical protein